MNRTPDRLRSAQTGAVGMIIIMWLAVVVLIGVAAIDAGSIAFTKFRLADVASSAASTAAANAYRSEPEHRRPPVRRPRPPSRPTTPSAKLAKKGCVDRRRRRGTVTITVRKEAKTIIAATPGLHEEVHQGERHGDQRADRPVALSRVTEPEPDEELVRRSTSQETNGPSPRSSSAIRRGSSTSPCGCWAIPTTRATPPRTRSCRCCASSRSSAGTPRSRRGSTASPSTPATTSCGSAAASPCSAWSATRTTRSPRPARRSPTTPTPPSTRSTSARALQLIPEEYRVTLVLADIQDLPYEEIARVLDVPMGTVKSRVHRGRIALARAMGLDGPRLGNRRPPPGRRRESHDASRRAPRRLRRRHPVRPGAGRRRGARGRMRRGAAGRSGSPRAPGRPSGRSTEVPAPAGIGSSGDPGSCGERRGRRAAGPLAGIASAASWRRSRPGSWSSPWSCRTSARTTTSGR